MQIGTTISSIAMSPPQHSLSSSREALHGHVKAQEIIPPVAATHSGERVGTSNSSLTREQASGNDNGDESKVKGEKQVQKAAQERHALLDERQIKQLAARDREVRAHEQAHMAVGGRYAGAASYTYERGPNGVNYAVGGEVPISTGREATPEATLLKAQIVKRAALAPAAPSPADRQVAAEAARMELQARQEIALEQQRKSEAIQPNKSEESSVDDHENDGVGEASFEAKGPISEQNPKSTSESSSTDGHHLNSRAAAAIKIYSDNASSPGILISQVA